MKKKGILNYLIIAAFAISAAFMSCDKNKDDDKNGNGNTGNSLIIEAENVINSSNNIATACAIIQYDKVLASTKYQNNAFTLTLPSSVDDKSLCLFTDYYDFEDTWFNDGMISDKNAKMVFAYVHAWDSDKNDIGGFIHEAMNDDETKYAHAQYIYLDRDVTIKGRNDYQWGYFFVDCSFTKGWNIMYYVEGDETEGVTTNKPTGVTWYWNYDDWSKLPERKMLKK